RSVRDDAAGVPAAGWLSADARGPARATCTGLPLTATRRRRVQVSIEFQHVESLGTVERRQGAAGTVITDVLRQLTGVGVRASWHQGEVLEREASAPTPSGSATAPDRTSSRPWPARPPVRPSSHCSRMMNG